MVIVTHEVSCPQGGGRIVFMDKGQIVEKDGPRRSWPILNPKSPACTGNLAVTVWASKEMETCAGLYQRSYGFWPKRGNCQKDS